jgi:hypothetical protein
MSQDAAYEGAGYKPSRHNAHALNTKQHIVRRIQELQAPAAAKVMLTIEQLYETFLQQGTYDPAVFDEVKSPEDLRTKVDETTRRLLVKGWKYDRQGRMILDLVDKEKAMERIARHQSFFNDTLKVDMGNFGSLLERAEKGVLDD